MFLTGRFFCVVNIYFEVLEIVMLMWFMERSIWKLNESNLESSDGYNFRRSMLTNEGKGFSVFDNKVWLGRFWCLIFPSEEKRVLSLWGSSGFICYAVYGSLLLKAYLKWNSKILYYYATFGTNKGTKLTMFWWLLMWGFLCHTNYRCVWYVDLNDERCWLNVGLFNWQANFDLGIFDCFLN